MKKRKSTIDGSTMEDLDYVEVGSDGRRLQGRRSERESVRKVRVETLLILTQDS